jgi:DNA-binding GntR family transcriptional regulator
MVQASRPGTARATHPRLLQEARMPDTTTQDPTRTPAATHSAPAGHAAAAPGEPLYRQLVEALRADILGGVFRIGAQLPTEEALGARFGVSRHTVREALRQLRANGLVASRQGSGTTVLAPPQRSSFNVHRVASIDELLSYSAESRYVVERTAMVSSADSAAMDQDLPADRRWLHLQGFRLTGEAPRPPICSTEVFVAAAYAGVERLMRSQHAPIWRLIEDVYGERIVEVEQTLRVLEMPEAIAERLQVAAGSSAVEVRRAYTTASGGLAEVGVNLYPADTFRFSMKLRRA